MSNQCLTMVAAALLWLTSASLPAAPRGSGGADPVAGGFVERVDVELVNVDVWVADQEGQPVSGLTAADFEIWHDGEPVPITHFTEILGGAEVRGSAGERSGVEAPPAVTPGVGPTAFFPGHLVVYFDQSRIHPRNYRALIEGLAEMLSAEGVEPERVMVVRQDRSLFVEAPFGSSKSQLEVVLDGIAKGGASGMDLETETRQALQAIRSSWDQSQDAVGLATTGLSSIPGGDGGAGDGGGPRAVVGGLGSGAGPDACGSFLSQIRPILDGFTRSRGQRIAITLANLSDTASFLAGLPGVKVLLYLSDGLDTRPGAALASYASGLCPARAADMLGGAAALEMSAPFLELTRHANANRVTIYSLQATGLRSPGAGDAKSERSGRGGSFGSRAAFESTQRSSEREGLGVLADETGGRVILNRNRFGPELAKIGQDLGTYYSLAYQPPAGGGEGKARREHQIEVRLSDDSLTARYRRGYLEKDADQWLAEKLEGALNLGITDNPLDVRLGAGDVRAGGEGNLLLPLYVMVPVERLAFLPRDGASVAEVTVRAMTRSIASNVVAIRGQTFRVKGAPGATGWANLTFEIELPEGAHATAVGVRDEGTGEASFVATTLQVGPGG